MAVKKITLRWLFNSFGVIVIIILAVEVIFAISISRYYYNAVSQTLRARATLVNSAFSQYYAEGGANQYNQMRDYVATFDAKSQMELMTIDGNGNIALTSSGFIPDSQGAMNDYLLALASEDRTGEYINKANDTRIMAVSMLAPVNDSSLSAVRLAVSLENVDRQIGFLIVGMSALGIAMLLLVLFSSSYFIGTIVNPVGEVGQTARRIADGDFEAHLEKKYNDEIGDLCDTINYMAEKLGEAERLKNDFISSVSHELRTPLTAIQGWGETLMDDDGQDKDMLRRGMGIIISEAGRLNQMVEELLDFSRMQSGRFQLRMSRTDPLAELGDVVLMYTERAKREGITLTFDDNDLMVPVMGDKNKLRQVFVNIIDNAVKYSDPGGSILVTARATPQLLTITVADKGIGIRPEDLPKVKIKFFKADSTRRSSGIGLAVADEIITHHGGTLELKSVYNEGTTVTITLPVQIPGKSEKEQVIE